MNKLTPEQVEDIQAGKAVCLRIPEAETHWFPLLKEDRQVFAYLLAQQEDSPKRWELSILIREKDAIHGYPIEQTAYRKVASFAAVPPEYLYADVLGWINEHIEVRKEPMGISRFKSESEKVLDYLLVQDDVYLQIPEGETHHLVIEGQIQQMYWYHLVKEDGYLKLYAMYNAGTKKESRKKEYLIAVFQMNQVEEILTWIEEKVHIRKDKHVASMYAIGAEQYPGIAKLIEECAEVLQIAGKIQGIGHMGKHWDGSNLTERLQEEIGDVLAAIDYAIQHNELDQEFIQQRQKQKRELFEKWHEEQK